MIEKVENYRVFSFVDKDGNKCDDPDKQTIMLTTSCAGGPCLPWSATLGKELKLKIGDTFQERRLYKKIKI